MKILGILGLGLLLGTPGTGELLAARTGGDGATHVETLRLADGTHQVCEVRPGEVRVLWRAGGGASDGQTEQAGAGIARGVWPCGGRSPVARTPRAEGACDGRGGRVDGEVAGRGTRAPAPVGWTVTRATGTGRVHGAATPFRSTRSGNADGAGIAVLSDGGARDGSRVRVFTTRPSGTPARDRDAGDLEERVTDLERRVDALERELGDSGRGRASPFSGPSKGGASGGAGKGGGSSQMRLFRLPGGLGAQYLRVPSLRAEDLELPEMNFELPEVEWPEGFEWPEVNFELPEVEWPEMNFELPDLHGVNELESLRFLDGERVIELDGSHGARALVLPGTGDRRVLRLDLGDGRGPRVLRFSAGPDGETTVEVEEPEAADEETESRDPGRARDAGLRFFPDDDGAADEEREGGVERELDQLFEGVFGDDEPADAARVATLGSGEAVDLEEVGALVDELRRQVEDLRAGLGDLRRRVRADVPGAAGADL